MAVGLLACLSPNFCSLLRFESCGIYRLESRRRRGAVRSLPASLMTFGSSACGQEKTPLRPTVSILIASERKRALGKVTAHPRTTDGSVAIRFHSTMQCYTRQAIYMKLRSDLSSNACQYSAVRNMAAGRRSCSWQSDNQQFPIKVRTKEQTFSPQ